MQPVAANEADKLFDELEQVLTSERDALRALDLSAIERATDAKTKLDARLRALGERGGLQERHKPRVARIREAAHHNQLLLAHARTCVRGAIAAATGAENVSYGSGGRPTAPTAVASPIRVNVKG